MDKEILYKFFNNAATADQERLLLEWLDKDPANYAFMLAERKIFDATLLHARNTKKRGMLATLPHWLKESIRYAAVVALVVTATALYFTRVEYLQATALNTITVPAGQRVNIVLSDGTKVCMNALSQLEYPAVFTGSKRTVKLTGEAFFDVAHDKSNPFVVQTYACDVEVLGTQFDVEAIPASGEFAVALVEGSVKVSSNDNPARSVTLSPNQEARYKNGEFVVGTIPEHETFQWRDGLITFRDATFSELILEFERYYGVNIEVERNDVSKTQFTGKIRISEGLDHALWVLQQSVDFSFQRNETREIIYIK